MFEKRQVHFGGPIILSQNHYIQRVKRRYVILCINIYIYISFLFVLKDVEMLRCNYRQANMV